MKTNLLVAISNLAKNTKTDLIDYYKASNRANNMGDALEYYIKDLFCNSINEKEVLEKDKIFSETFSYIGNQNNPPDLIIKNGDAIEIKKIESSNSGLALNSSYPKDKLYYDSPMITAACRKCEDWREKDIIYSVGVSTKNKLSSLWFVYGDCYAADKEVYERIRSKISKGVNELPDVEFSKTKELGRVNKVDPLGITYLRIRGMWGIENPIKVFNYVSENKNKKFFCTALMTKNKFNSFPEEDKNNLKLLVSNNLSIKDIKIKSPNNPAKLLDAVLINFYL